MVNIYIFIINKINPVQYKKINGHRKSAVYCYQNAGTPL